MLRVVLNSISLFGLLAWIVASLFGFTAYMAAYFLTVVFFDAEAKDANPIHLYLIGSVLVYPLFALVGFFGSNGLWKMKNPDHWRRHLALLPLAPILVILISWLASAE